MPIHVDQMIHESGKYELLSAIHYYSNRYKKWIVVEPGIYDGATGAIDINSGAWWVHDQLCKTKKWDDGTTCSNWQASQVLQDILVEESPKGWKRFKSWRWWQSRYWFWATYLFRKLEGNK